MFRDIFWNQMINVVLYQNGAWLLVVLTVSTLGLMLCGVFIHEVYVAIERHCFGKLFEKTRVWELALNKKVYGYYDQI